MNPKKYIDQFMALEEAAKNEIIELLKNNPKGRYIQPNEHHGEDELFATEGVWTLTGDEDAIIIGAVGLFDDGELRFRASLLDYDYNDYDWFTLDEFTHPYCALYKFVVNNLDNADQEPFVFPEEKE